MKVSLKLLIVVLYQLHVFLQQIILIEECSHSLFYVVNIRLFLFFFVNNQLFHSISTIIFAFFGRSFMLRQIFDFLLQKLVLVDSLSEFKRQEGDLLLKSFILSLKSLFFGCGFFQLPLHLQQVQLILKALFEFLLRFQLFLALTSLFSRCSLSFCSVFLDLKIARHFP